ncbi:DUF4123 domain-containing protein [Burkholderia cenocepacia]|uniref:DUF4123 domain-containing protein n=1 Tax=Burkholderia cenocepacia TaxID=95486 RepID=UPI001F3B0D30|nr:DUF4123 domain-containing protein [Burkholderia cenocepacia]
MDEVNDTVARNDPVGVSEAVDAEPNPREPEWPAFLETLKASVTRTDDAGSAMRIYALVDTRGYQELDVQLAAVPRLRCASLWADTGLDAYTDIAPYLIAFDHDAINDENAEQHRLLRQLWLEAVDLHAVTWLWSTWSFDALDQHLCQYVQYKLPNGRAYYLFFSTTMYWGDFDRCGAIRRRSSSLRRSARSDIATGGSTRSCGAMTCRRVKVRYRWVMRRVSASDSMRN